MSSSNDSIKFLDSAIAGHIQWRTRLNDFAVGKGKIDPAVACRDDACPLGKWIYADGKEFSGFAQFGDVKSKHAEFHRCAGEIAGEICSGNVEAAKKTLASESSAFSRATAATVEAVQALRAVIHVKENQVFRWGNFSIRSKLFLGCGINMAMMLAVLMVALYAEASAGSVLGLFAVVLALNVAMAVFVSAALSQPAALMRDLMSKVASTGDLSVRVDARGGDEIGQAMIAFNDMLDMLQMATMDVNHVVSALANGVFDERIILNARGDLKVMKDAVNASAESVKVTMGGLNEVMKALCNGDFSQRMSTQVKGEFKLAVDQAMQAMLGDVGGVMAKVSDGDLSRRVTAEGRGDLARLKENINASLVSLSSVMKAVGQNTQQVAAASNQTSNAIGQISDGAQNQMHAINQVATAVQQTAAAVTEVARSAESANTRAQGMGKAVNEGIADMDRMVEIVQAIATNADRIDKITDVIEKIANKTNLLSLNAAIEAARAGEHGKGFAVVAEEVGKLAASAAESTQEITALVKQAVEDADRATGTVTLVNKGMQEISNGARQTEAELQRISAAMEQQNAAISEINANVGSLNRIASANASAAEEITSTVIELARLADGTRREVEKFST